MHGVRNTSQPEVIVKEIINIGHVRDIIIEEPLIVRSRCRYKRSELSCRPLTWIRNHAVTIDLLANRIKHQAVGSQSLCGTRRVQNITSNRSVSC